MAIHLANQKIGAPVAVYWEIRAQFGEVPAFLATVPESQIAVAWAELTRLAGAMAER